MFAVDASFGDGVTDASAHVQARITACANGGGGTVFFPAGIYLLSTSLNVTNTVTLVGAGKEPFNGTVPVSRLRFKTANGNGIVTTTQGCQIRNLSIECAAAGNPTARA